MLIYPAVDIKEGRSVRLKKGDFNQEKVYFDDPIDAAQKWVSEGAKILHVVDLDGAREGRLINIEPIKRIVGLGVDIQLGGGLRSISILKTAFDIGVKRAVIGTALIKDRSLAKQACEQFGAEHIVAGVDLKEGLVSIEGWQEGASVGYETLLKQLLNLGIKNLIVTDIGRDGMEAGPNFRLMEKIALLASDFGFPTNFNVIASGGVSSLEDIKKLAGIGVDGVIIGTALYEGRFTLKEAIRIASDSSRESIKFPSPQRGEG